MLGLYSLLRVWLVAEDQQGMARLEFEPTDQHPTAERHTLLADMVLEHLMRRAPWEMNLAGNADR